METGHFRTFLASVLHSDKGTYGISTDATEEAQCLGRRAHKGKHGLMFELALHSGMRPEEYLGLKWGDIDLQAGTVTVQRTLVWKRWKNESYFGEPKTARSRRTIPLPG